MHPELEGTPEGEMIKFVEKIDMTQAWCKGCSDWAPVNAAFAKYCKGEISSCSRCRK
jgi:hypothetical protein